jgi:hypothetical protein
MNRPPNITGATAERKSQVIEMPQVVQDRWSASAQLWGR